MAPTLATTAGNGRSSSVDAVRRGYLPIAVTLDASEAASETDSDLLWKVEEWRRWTYRLLTSNVVASPNHGPSPPGEWAPALHQLTALARVPVPPPSWWTPSTAFCGNIETRTNPTSYRCHGMNSPGPKDPSVLYFQLSLAGWGHFRVNGEEPQKVTPGRAFFALRPSQDHHYLPEESPGWTFAWLGICHAYLRDRVAKQVAATGPLIDIPPNEALTATVLRLVRGAIKKDFRDQFEAELALVEFVLAFERWAQQAGDRLSEGQRLMDEVRSRILARLPHVTGVRSLAADFGMSRSHFSCFFRERTGLTPARFATEVRIEKAANMLLDTHAPLKTIADACGFANTNHFSKVFRRVRHLSPVSFRQVCR